MSNGLSLTRATYPNANELYFLVEDSNGNTIPIKQTFLRLEDGQIKINIQASNQVKVYRGELLPKAKQ